MHRIAQICTYIFRNFQGVAGRTPGPHNGKRQAPASYLCLHLGTRRPSHFFRASAAADVNATFTVTHNTSIRMSVTSAAHDSFGCVALCDY